MKSKINFFFLFISLVAVLLAACAKYHGEIFTKDVANQKFSKVQQSIELPTSTLRSLLNKTNSNVMFKVMGDRVIILDNKRNVIYPEGVTVNQDEVFSMFSVSVVNELLSQGNYPNVNIEGRGTALTITYGDKTMEVATLCPPICD